MSTSDADPLETAWCAGFRQSGVRKLSPAEADELRVMARRFLAQGRGALAVLITAFVGAAVTLLLGAPPVLGALALFAAVLVTPLGLVLTRDWLSRARSLREDADAGWLRQFSGRVTPGPAPDELRDRLVRRRLLFADPRLDQWFEVLPASHVMWTANGHRLPTWVRAEPNVLAGVPEYAATAAEWVEPSEQPGSEGIHYNFRELTPAECGEVRKHAQKLLLRPLGGALLFTVWASLLLISGSLQEQPLAMFIFGGFAAWSWWHVLRVLGVAARLRRDAEAGRVVIIRRSLPEANAGGSADLTPPDEFLPESGIPWTVAEQPASWRHSASR